MRVTGGKIRGRRIDVPEKGVRPTQDMVREALFSILAERVPGSIFLDLFAGSGSVGLEAWSRGAGNVTFVERSRSGVSVLKRNTTLLCDTPVTVCCMDSFLFIEKYLEEKKYDIIFADPPYEKKWEVSLSGETMCERLLGLLKESSILADDGLFVMEQLGSMKFSEVDGWELLRNRKYGRASIGIYRKS